MPVESDSELRELLDYRRVAVVGCSTTAGKPAHEVPAYLRDHGYEIIPVNPYAETVFDERAYDSLADVEETVDLVEVFRPSEELSGIVDDAIERDDVEAVWAQVGIRDDDAAARAEEAGLRVVQDRCMRTEHQRLID